MKTKIAGMMSAMTMAIAAGAACGSGGALECAFDPDCGPGTMCVEGVCMPVEDSSGGILLTGEEPRLDLPATSETVETCADVERLETHAGCRFWAVDLPNMWEPTVAYSLDISNDQQFAVVVTNVTTAASAEVAVFRGGSSDPVAAASVEPGEVHTFNLPAENFDPTVNGGAKAYRIESDVPIAAYQFQPLSNNTPVYSNDASALFPEHVLGNDYMAITGDAILLNMYPNGPEAVTYNAGAFVTVVAVANETRVDFRTTAGLQDPKVEALVLGRGDAFTIFSDLDNIQGSPTGDLSGTRLAADKPIAVFSGSVSTVIPVEAGKCCADHVEHQMLPLWAWGRAYVVAPPPAAQDPERPAPALYRLTGAFDGTALRYDFGPKGAPTTVNAGETVIFEADHPFAVYTLDPEKSFALTQFLMSTEAADPSGSNLGDPAMTVVPAAAQMQRSYGFLVPEGYTDNYVTIVAPSAAKVVLDGEEVAVGNVAAELDGEKYRYANVRLEPGPHNISASDPISITVLGYDDWVSYAYTGGSGVLPISEVPPTP